MEIDAGVTQVITQVTESEARELLACMKFMISLERIGDLLLSFASSAQAVCARLDPQDIRDLTHMATVLEKMLSDAGAAFSTRDVKKAVDVLRADAEMDRLRNLIFLRHIENPENLQRQASLQVIFMTQSLERAGDHAKNLAEEVCHFVSGHTVRHVLMTYDKPIEQMFLDWLRAREEHSDLVALLVVTSVTSFPVPQNYNLQPCSAGVSPAPAGMLPAPRAGGTPALRRPALSSMFSGRLTHATIRILDWIASRTLPAGQLRGTPAYRPPRRGRRLFLSSTSWDTRWSPAIFARPTAAAKST